MSSLIPIFSYFKVNLKSNEKFNRRLDKFHENNILSLHIGKYERDDEPVKGLTFRMGR